MNRTIAIAAIALSAVTSAFADDITLETAPFVSALSRAEVRAELQQSQRAGVDPWSQAYQPLAAFHSVRSRAEVRADYLQSRGQAAALTGEDSGSAWFASHAVDASAVLAGQPVNAR